MKKNSKNIAGIVLPLVVAIVVIITFAISGHLTKTSDEKNPTASTSVSVANEVDTTKEETVNSKVSLVAVGDNLIHNTLITAGEQDDGTLNYTSFYSNIKPYIESADIAVINQETMLGGSSFDYSGYPMFNTPWEVGEAAIDAGFDIFTCATNHAMDVGSAGIEKENEFFSKHKNVVHIGTNQSEEGYNKITYYEKNGITFALLNYTYGTNGISLPSDKPWIVNLMDKDKITKDVTEAKKNADVVIVFAHWGTENSTEISSYQEEYATLFASLGVDIVIGTHPHVLEPVKWIDRQDGKKMLVYYSLGNFISHQTSLDQLCGGMAEITIEKHSNEISITSAKLAPVICWLSKSGDKYSFSAYKYSDYTDDIASTNSKDGATVKYFTDYATKVIDEEFLDLK